MNRQAEERMWRNAIDELIRGTPPWLTAIAIIGSEDHKAIAMMVNGDGRNIVAMIQQAADEIEDALIAADTPSEGTA